MSQQTVIVGESGSDLLSKINNNFTELYQGSGSIGYIIQDTDIINTDGWWDTMILTHDTFFIVNDYDFDSASITIPEGVTLIFNGGVWSNGNITGTSTIFSTYGLRQCFSTTLTLNGTWNVPYITPQHYGAITNSRTDTFSNDSTAAIQKCFDSLFPVYIPRGFYYVVSPMTITVSGKIVICDAGGLYSDAVATTPNHTRLYTDQNIDVITVSASGLIWQNGIIDVIRATTYSSNVFTFNCNVYLGAPKINRLQLFSSWSKLLTGAHTGTGFYVNTDITTTPWGGSYSAEMTEVGLHYFRIGFYKPALGNPLMYSFFSIFTLNGQFTGNKQDIVLDDTSDVKISGYFQGVLVCSEDELPIYSIDIEDGCVNSEFDLEMSDYGENTDDAYSPLMPRNRGVHNRFIGRSEYRLTYMTFDVPPEPNFYLTNPKGLHINHSSRDRNLSLPKISVLDNQFAFLQKTIPGVVVAMYDGEGYDFDTKLGNSATEGLSSTTSMSIAVGTGAITDMFNARKIPVGIKFNNVVGKIDTDFLEVVIPIAGNENYVYHENPIFDIFLHNSNCQFQRIQTIMKYSGSDVVTNIYPPEISPDTNYYRYTPVGQDQLLAGGLQTMIIRFIGGTAAFTTNEYVYMIELYSKAEKNFYPPQIDVGGGQTIFGTLKVTSGVTETTLPVYADNTAAKAGGLTDGMPYRTSTGVRMVVYT